MCVPAKRIVNQLTTARKIATAPSNPSSPPSLVRPPPPDTKPTPAPPTRIRCGIARISRNAVVTLFRFVSDGSTFTETGYGMALTIQPQLSGLSGERRFCVPRVVCSPVCLAGAAPVDTIAPQRYVPCMVNTGLDGVVAATTSLSLVDGERGELVIAGFQVGELARRATF